MTTDNSPLNDQEMMLVFNALDAMELNDQILKFPAEGKNISFAEIYAYATKPDYNPSDQLLMALSEDSRVRRDFEMLLRNTSPYFLPQVAAASSGEISNRAIDGCKLTFRSSRADPKQLFVIIEMSDIDASPSCLFVCPEGQPTEKVTLPRARGGKIQLLFEADARVLRALRDINTEVFLR